MTVASKTTPLRLLPIAAAVVFGLALSGCDGKMPWGASKVGATEPKSEVKPNAVIAIVDNTTITENDLAPLIASGLDRANAVDRSINRAIAARLGKEQFATQVSDALHTAEVELAAGVYASNKMAALQKEVTQVDIEQRYNSAIKDADFTGYQLAFTLYGTEEEARAGRTAAMEGKADALKAYQPVAADKDGKALFISRNDVPYNLGVFVAKLKEGGFTEPALVRNGYIVLQAQHIKVNTKPTLEATKDILRKTIADERLVKLLADARKESKVVLK